MKKRKRYVRRAIVYLSNIQLKRIVWIPLLCIIAGSMMTYALAAVVAQAGGGLDELIIEARGGDADHTPEKAKEAAEKGIRLFSATESEDMLILEDAFENKQVIGVDIYSDSYDNMIGSTGSEKDIKDMYTALSNIYLVEETNVQATLGYSYLYFNLKDGSEIKLTFEDEKYVKLGDKIYCCYEDGTLWEIVDRILAE